MVRTAYIVSLKVYVNEDSQILINIPYDYNDQYALEKESKRLETIVVPIYVDYNNNKHLTN